MIWGNDDLLKCDDEPGMQWVGVFRMLGVG